MKMKLGSALRTMSVAMMLSTCAVAAAGQTPSTEAPAKPAETKSAPPRTELARSEPESVQTYYLSSVTQVNDANEILTALRNILDPRVRIYLSVSENAITIRATADQMTIAQRLLKELDRPKKTFRLIYTVTDMDGGRKIGVQHFAIVLAPGGRTVLKQGSRVPIATGSLSTDHSGQNTQFTYLDVGVNIDASIDGYVDGVRLRTKVEQSSVAEEHLIMGVQEPVIRQTVLEGTSILTQGKPLVLGSMDVPGSTRHLEVEVVLEPVA